MKNFIEYLSEAGQADNLKKEISQKIKKLNLYSFKVKQLAFDYQAYKFFTGSRIRNIGMFNEKDAKAVFKYLENHIKDNNFFDIGFIKQILDDLKSVEKE